MNMANPSETFVTHIEIGEKINNTMKNLNKQQQPDAKQIDVLKREIVIKDFRAMLNDVIKT